jgi:hypothetical protein
MLVGPSSILHRHDQLFLNAHAVIPLSNRAPYHQAQCTLVNKDEWFGCAVLNRRILAMPPEILAEILFFCADVGVQ